MLKLFLLTWIIIYFANTSFAESLDSENNQIAKAIIIRGQVTANDRILSKNEWVKEGQIIATGKGSIGKFLFKDNSNVTVGPESKIVLKEFKPKSAGLMGLLKGQIRTNISKDPIIGNKSNKKLYIRTDSASIGVRGTDFQVSYNPTNEKTLLLTFNGEVIISNVYQADIGESLSVDQMEKLLSTEDAMVVTRGTFSETGPNQNAASIPVKISPAQFNTLLKNTEFREPSEEDSKSAASKDSKGKSPIPPGVDTKLFANEKPGEDSEIDQDGNAPPEGSYDPKTGRYAPAAGGYLDPATGIYISPPPGSAFDPVAKVFTPPSNIGSFNFKTGEYNSPPGYKLLPSGEFIVDKNYYSPSGEKPSLKNRPIIFTPKMLLALQQSFSPDSSKDLLEKLISSIFREGQRKDFLENLPSNSPLQFNFIIQN